MLTVRIVIELGAEIVAFLVSCVSACSRKGSGTYGEHGPTLQGGALSISLFSLFVPLSRPFFFYIFFLRPVFCLCRLGSGLCTPRSAGAWRQRRRRHRRILSMGLRVLQVTASLVLPPALASAAPFGVRVEAEQTGRCEWGGTTRILLYRLPALAPQAKERSLGCETATPSQLPISRVVRAVEKK
ncbi:hypothetical protein LX36DRAFT_398280 [Colletotrichum falcatum]|nr:hypothetical protein LX36DRAFT_398280 [Colletotrichum falcatum]